MSFKPPEDSGDRDAPFNMAMLYYLNLIKMIEKKDEEFSNNSLAGWYKCLNRIFTKIVFKLKAEEERELSIMFSSAKYHIEHNNPLSKEILHRIDIRLMKLMDRYKMIFPNIDISKGLKKLSDKYKLVDEVGKGG